MTRPFRFKEFTISQVHAPMKVGTDGVLVGAWVSCKNVNAALDIGTGTGLIALMLAQRNPTIHVTAIEPNADAVTDAADNIVKSDFGSRIDLIHRALEEFSTGQKFDLIVSNPPFFLHDLKSPDPGRSMARHAQGFDFSAFAKASEFLSPRGCIAGIYPVAIFEKFDTEIGKYGYFPKRICEVKPTPEKKTHRVLFEYGREPNVPTEWSTLIIEAHGRHQYSAEYIALTRDFYLNF